MEQDVVCQTPSLAAHYEAVQALVGNLAVDEADRLRLTLLFGLRYERDGQVQLAALLRTLTEQVRCAVCCAVVCDVLHFGKLFYLWVVFAGGLAPLSACCTTRLFGHASAACVDGQPAMQMPSPPSY